MKAVAPLLPRSERATRRLRVCIVTETYPPEINGAAMTIGRLVEGLLARGHRVQLLRPRQAPDDMPRREGTLRILPQPGLVIPFYRELKLGLPVGRTLKRLWRKAAPDVVHIVTEGPLGNSALSVARRLKLPVSSSFHTNFHRYSRYYGFGILAKPIMAYLRRFHNRTACTLVPTEELAGQLQELGFMNTRILSRGVDTQLFSPRQRSEELRRTWGVKPDDPVVLYVGRLAAEKNLDLAVQAYQAMHQEQPNARFVLVGDGPLAPTLRARYPDFIYCGVRRGEELAAHYASADIFVFPSLTETFGNVTIEAMASGLAVVVFDYAAARHYLAHDHNGLRAPLGDSAAFVEAARGLVRTPERIQRLGREARRTAENVSWIRVYEHLEAIFLELVLQGKQSERAP